LLRKDGELKVVDLLAVVIIDGGGHGGLRDRNSLSLVCTRDTVADHGINATGTSREVPGVVERALGDEIRVACRGLATSGSAVGGSEKALIELAVLSGQETVVFTKVDLVSAGNVDKAIVVLALGVLVDQTTGHDAHLLAVKDGNVGESARLDKVASVLRKEDGNAGVAEEVDQLAVARLLESAIAAPITLYQHAVHPVTDVRNLPFVVVEAEEVDLG
jgi:hypothetical protein